MPTWATSFTDLLWHSAIGVVPLAIIVAAICRWGSCRPATRHVLWLGVLAWLPAGLLLPQLSFSFAGVSTETTSPPGDRQVLRPIKAREEAATDETARLPHRLQGWEAESIVDKAGMQSTPAQSHTTPTITPAKSSEHAPSSADQLEYASGLVLDDRLAPEPTAGQAVFRPVEPLQSPASLRHTDNLKMKIAPQPVMEHPPADETTSAPPALRTQLARWLAGLAAVRDAVGRLPTFPSALWLAGIVLIVAFRLHSVIRFRNRLRASTPAPPSVVALVAKTAAKLGLRRIPETIMVRDRISPMIWCGRRARLVLPKRLWDELDDQGRRAVVYHELAHVRRKDHWVCWAELLVIATYWWHPLVWWVRGKMRDEAENCCDAWVTWLLPRGRRAYAEALLMTRQFAGESTVASAAPAIGMVTGKTKRFARRLTMIMTQQQTPRLSTSGIMLALSLAVAGCVATPARSAEPKAPQVVEVALPTAPVAIVAPSPPSVALAPTAVITLTPPVAPLVSTAMVAPRSSRRASAGPSDRKLAERMERLERQLAELAERLEKAGPRVYSTETAPAKTWRNLITGAPSGLARRYAVAATPPGREIVETYRLPKGQLEALTKLMVLPDVPIRVRPRDGAIEVHGTRADHDRFKAFIGLLSDEKSVEAYRLPPGKLKALTALMALDDVPVMVQPGSKEIKVQGSPAVQAVFKAFVQMIHPEKDGRGGAPRGPRALEGALRRGLDAGETARRAYGRALAGRTGASGRSYERATRLKAKDLKKRAQAEMRRATRDLSKHTKDLERQAERLEAEADRLEDRAERAREKANNLREKMRRTGKPDKADRLGSEADAFEAQADELEAQAEVLLAKAEAVQDKVEAIEEQAEEVTEQIEERVERELEAIEEAIEAAEEDADDDHDDDADDDDDDDDDEDDDGSCRSP